MDVLCHTTEAVNPTMKPFDRFLHEQKKSKPVTILEKNRGSGVATQDDVINSAEVMDAGFTGNWRIIPDNIRMSRLTAKVGDTILFSWVKYVQKGKLVNNSTTSMGDSKTCVHIRTFYDGILREHLFKIKFILVTNNNAMNYF